MDFYFGPSIPNIPNVPISFVSNAPLTVPNTLAFFSSDRYCPENYSFINKNLKVIEDIPVGKKLNITWNTGTLGALNTVFPSGVGLDSVNLNGVVECKESSWGPEVLNESILVKYVQQTEAGSWLPTIKQGTVWRKFTYSTTNGEPVWLNNIGLNDGETVILIYTTPEVHYQERLLVTDPFFLGSSSQSISTKRSEVCSVIQDKTFSFLGYIQGVYSIDINGVNKFTSVTPVNPSSIAIIDSMDLEQRTIKFKGIELLPEDKVVITYATPNDNFVYSGFQTPSLGWRCFDLNPEYGHWCSDYNSVTPVNTKDALNQTVNLFAVPTSVIRYTINYRPNTDEVYADIVFTFYSAFDLGETHFIRHVLTSERSEIITNREGAGLHSTYGSAVFGRNYYNEFNSNLNDVYSTKVPSMLPIAKFTSVLNQGSTKMVTNDIRRRGGGIPDNFNFDSISTEEDGLDTLRSFFDLGIWEGTLLQEGGKVVIKIDPSILKTDPSSTDPNTFLASEIEEMVQKNILPGIGYEIVMEAV